MIEFTTTIHKFDKKGEKTGWTYIEISAAQAGKIKPAVSCGFYFVEIFLLLAYFKENPQLNNTVLEIRIDTTAALSIKISNLGKPHHVTTTDPESTICLKA